MYDRKALAARMAKARFAAASSYGRSLSYEKIGELLEGQIGGERQYSASTVQRYFDAKVERINVEVLFAYAHITGVPPGWLAFGDDRDKGQIPEERKPIPGVPGSRPTSGASKRRPAG